MANTGLEYNHFMETHNINMATFRYDNSVEHIKFKEKLVQIGKNIAVEFSALNAP